MPILNWSGKDKIVNYDSDVPVHVLNHSYNFGGDTENKIIHGDNLLALKSLLPVYESKIKCIYIDPPYNTGNEGWIYNDNVNDPRLKLLKRLLADDGAIFISIDDNEVASLKFICDEIFGSQNFVAQFVWQSRQSLQNDTDLSINHEYIVSYAKKRRQQNRRLKVTNAAFWHSIKEFAFLPLPIDESKFSNPDNDPRGAWKADPFDAPNIRPNLTYPIINQNTGEKFLPPQGRHWRVLPEKFNELLADNRIIFGKTGKTKPQLKVFLSEQQQIGSVPNSWFNAEKYGTYFKKFSVKKIFSTLQNRLNY